MCSIDIKVLRTLRRRDSLILESSAAAPLCRTRAPAHDPFGSRCSRTTVGRSAIAGDRPPRYDNREKRGGQAPALRDQDEKNAGDRPPRYGNRDISVGQEHLLLPIAIGRSQPTERMRITPAASFHQTSPTSDLTLRQDRATYATLMSLAYHLTRPLRSGSNTQPQALQMYP